MTEPPGAPPIHTSFFCCLWTVFSPFSSSPSPSPSVAGCQRREIAAAQTPAMQDGFFFHCCSLTAFLFPFPSPSVACYQQRERAAACSSASRMAAKREYMFCFPFSSLFLSRAVLPELHAVEKERWPLTARKRKTNVYPIKGTGQATLPSGKSFFGRRRASK